MLFDKQLGKKILVLGSPGSGKTALSTSISQIYKIPVYHLDDLYWHENWERGEEKEFAEHLQKIIMSKCWVIDGNYYHLFFQERLKEADTVILIDIPAFICVYRVLKRYLRIIGGDTTHLPKKVRDYAKSHDVRSNINWKFIKFVAQFRKKVLPNMKKDLLQADCNTINVYWYSKNNK